jgi:predicted RNA-binding Zn ribbon-like protein
MNYPELDVLLSHVERLHGLDLVLEVTVDTFTALAAACRAVETCLGERAADLEQELMVERESLEMTILLSDAKMIRMIDRHRTRISKESDQTLAAYDRTRKLVGEIESSGSLGAVPKVELKVISWTAR